MIGITPTPRIRYRVHLLFEEQAARTSDAIAILGENASLTYSELNSRANQIAQELRNAGVRPGDLVAIWGERSGETIIGMLGILKSGAAYVPLEPAAPDQRLRFILADAKPNAIIATAASASNLRRLADRLPIIEAATGINSGAECGGFSGALEPPSTDLAYVMYTSGSTGTPKGVLVRHRGIVQLVSDSEYCHFGPGEVLLHHSSLAFDASTFEIWGPLLNGGTVAILPPGYPTPDALERAIRKFSVTTLWLTAGLFHLVVDQRVELLRSLRQLVAGGDVLLPRYVERALKAMPSGVLVNGYGPTECTTFASCFRMTPEYFPGASVPIGKPIAGAALYVLDSSGRPVAPGVSGELHVGGGGVALGYLNNPELTSEKFIADPFSADHESRLYRTGDKARWNEDGNLEFLGRLDEQFKISGFRIEPGEIEAALTRCCGVDQAVVVACPQARGEKQLVAYLVPSGPISIEELKQELRAALPHYMVPSRFEMIDRFPVNSNGKIDRAALCDRKPSRATEPSPDQATDLQRTLLAIWRFALGVPVDLDANFFDLGGTSLQLIEVHAEICALTDSEIPVTAVFQHPTVRAMADWLGGQRRNDAAMIQATNRASKRRDSAHRRIRRREIRA